MDFTPSEAQDELAGLARKILAQRGVAGHGVRGIPGGAECPPGQAEWDMPLGRPRRGRGARGRAA